MSKILQIVIMLTLSFMGLALGGFAIYSQYQASQFYPMLQQQIGFQACVQQVQAEQAKQQELKPNPVP